MAKYRLLANCLINDRLVRRGEIIEAPDSWKEAPMRSVRTEVQKYGDPLGGTHKEEPLFELVKDAASEPVPDTPPDLTHIFAPLPQADEQKDKP